MSKIVWGIQYVTLVGGGMIWPLALVRTGAAPTSPPGGLITVIHLVST
jgi:hypothetical protein